MTAVNVNVGHTVSLGLLFVDQHGNPMLVQPTPDASPSVAWSDDNAAAGKLTANGATATDLAVAPGIDNVTVHVSVGGQALVGTLAINVQAEPQVVSGVEIVANVS